MCTGDSVILDTQQTAVCSPCWLGTITPEQLFILEQGGGRRLSWCSNTIPSTVVPLFVVAQLFVCFFSLLMFFVVLDKERQTMTPGSAFGSWESRADCTSKRRIWSDGGASRTVAATELMPVEIDAKSRLGPEFGLCNTVLTYIWSCFPMGFMGDLNRYKIRHCIFFCTFSSCYFSRMYCVFLEVYGTLQP